MTETTQTEGDAEVRITRVFDASRERVFRAWTDPNDIAAWFSPVPLTTPPESVRVDLRVGGRYELSMVAPDGGESPLGFEIVELDPPALLVLRSDPMPDAGMPESTLVRIELHEEPSSAGQRTRLLLSDGPYPSGFGVHAERGWLSAFEKLAAVVLG
jgi:uncharacterized protein YndB with AHSA1/START domain